VLTSGKVFVMGGTSTGSNALSSTELLAEIVGSALVDSRRPIVENASASLLFGWRLWAASEGSSGTTQSSPSRLPFVRYRFMDSDTQQWAVVSDSTPDYLKSSLPAKRAGLALVTVSAGGVSAESFPLLFNY
jgi:hypothetical protein